MQERTSSSVSDEDILVALKGKERNKRGIFRWWLNLTAPVAVTDYAQSTTYEERHHSLMAQGVSLVGFLSLCIPIVLAWLTINNSGVTLILITTLVTTFIALILNKRGHSWGAALLIVMTSEAAIEFTLLQTAPLDIASLPLFDLFILPLFMVFLFFPRGYIWLFMLIHGLFIVIDIYLIPHSDAFQAAIASGGGLWELYGRAIFIQVVGAILLYGARIVIDEVLYRSDKSTYIEALHQRQLQQKERLEEGIEIILQTLIAASNGDQKARVQFEDRHELWRVARAINMFMDRSTRASEYENRYHALVKDLEYISEALRELDAGNKIVWPAETSTPADLLIRRFRAILHKRETLPPC